jgi:undecaprenyl-phosphate 4-deoxy-4-formamido-L-arabinose transferase
MCKAGDASGSNRACDKLGVTILLGLIVLFPISFMWQGLELTDTGYALANMQQFFRAYPADINDPGIGSCWLTYFIGATWYNLTGAGLIGFRALYLLILFGILGLVWLLVRKADTRRVSAAIFAGAAMVVARSDYVPSYNQFTAFFFILSAFALYFGLVKRLRPMVFLSGMLGGAAIFVRLPNLAIGGIVVAIVFYRFFQWLDAERSFGLSVRMALRECAVFGLGYLAGMGLVLVLIAAMGQLSTYFAMLGQTSAMLGDSRQHHGGGRLLRGLLHDYFYSGLASIAFVVAAIALGFVSSRTPNRAFRWLLGIVGTAGLTAVVLVSDDFATYFWPGLIYATLIAGACGFLSLNKEYRLLCVLAGVVLFLTPLGSNNGIYNSIYAMSLAVPVALIALIARPDAANRTISDAVEGRDSEGAGKPQIHNPRLAHLFARGEKFCSNIRATTARMDTSVVGYTILCTMVGFSVVHRWNFTYRDSPQRLALRATVNHSKLREVFTTASRARSLEELLKALRPLVRKDDYLLDHMQVPMIYFLTETRPYLYSTWANLYEPSVFERMIQKAVAARSGLPVCVRTKVDTCHPEWPGETYPLSQSYRFAENRRLIESFLQVHNYQKHWENNAFEIWLPPPSGSNGCSTLKGTMRNAVNFETRTVGSGPDPIVLPALEAGLSVIVPVYNSECSLPLLVERLQPVLDKLELPYELILVDDASRDKTWEIVQNLVNKYPWITGLSLMRNYGQHNALLCGIRAARYEVAVTMDDDLQNPPEEIPNLLAGLEAGLDVVYGTPQRQQHGLWRDLASWVTKLALQSTMGAATARNVSAFRAFRTSMRQAFAGYRSPYVSIDVLLTWGTARFGAVSVRHDARAVGESNYSFGKLLVHAMNMMTGFSTVPLQVASLLGFASTLFGIGLLIFVLGRYFLHGGSVPGFPFLACTIAIFSGVQLFALGIIGEYLARMHFRTMDRPTYTVRSKATTNGQDGKARVGPKTPTHNQDAAVPGKLL